MDEVDRLGNLPDSLLFKILSNFPTKDVVKTSVLSKKWRNLWKFVPWLELNCRNFHEFKDFASFVDKFLGSNSESCLHKFDIRYYNGEGYDAAYVRRWIDSAVKRNVQCFNVWGEMWKQNCDVVMTPALYTCESLVSLKLSYVDLPNLESVSLPSLKVINLDSIKFANDMVFEMLISSCPVLETLTMYRSFRENTYNLRVCSKSLLSFTLWGHFDGWVHEDLVVSIDAPMLEYLKLQEHEIDCFVVNNMDSLVKVHIDIVFNVSEDGRMFDPSNLPMMNMIRNFFLGVSNVKDIVFSSRTLKIIYKFLKCQPLPLFPNVSSMRATLYECHMLPIFLESFPNLTSLVLGCTKSRNYTGVSLITGRRCSLPSLEYVVMKSLKKPFEMKLARYFLRNSAILKKLAVFLGDYREKDLHAVRRELLTIPRLSTSCQVVVSYM